jgi:hypothetical protein
VDVLLLVSTRGDERVLWAEYMSALSGSWVGLWYVVSVLVASLPLGTRSRRISCALR